jgi:hypothetical protein
MAYTYDAMGKVLLTYWDWEMDGTTDSLSVYYYECWE